MLGREAPWIKNMYQCVSRMIVGVAFIGAGVCSAYGERSFYPPTISLEEIRHRISQCPHNHPRLFTTRKELAGLRNMLERDPLRRQMADFVIQQANLLREVEPVERKLEGRRLLSQSRRCVERVLILAMAYHLTGDVRHAQRCRQEMLAAARFSDWNPTHFLDVAEMTFALAIGYDWLYDQLDEASRKEIRKAIVEKGVAVPFETKHNGWVHAHNNWGQVCHGGLTVGALAVLEDEPDLAARTVHNALQNVVVSMAVYAPRGSYPEGPGYWAYGTSYNVLLIAALESVLAATSASRLPRDSIRPALIRPLCVVHLGCFSIMRTAMPNEVPSRSASGSHRVTIGPDWLLGERELWQKQLSQTQIATVQLSPIDSCRWRCSGWTTPSNRGKSVCHSIGTAMEKFRFRFIAVPGPIHMRRTSA